MLNRTDTSTPSLIEYQKDAVAWMLNIERIGKEEEEECLSTSCKKGKKRKTKYDHVQTGNELGLLLTERKVQKWKVLILDQFCFDILGPLFKVGDLRAMGVTLVMNINDNRQSIPDAPAVYFVRPTKENVDQICKDCENDLYESVYVNFCGSNYKRELLEDMANQMVQTESTHKVSKLFDQFLNFFCIESNFFSLGLNRSLASIYNPTLNEDQIMDQLDAIASGITSVILTMGAAPLLACTKYRSQPASMIAQRVEKRLRNAQMSAIQYQQSSLSEKSRRPIVIIVDRSVDYSVCLQHQWTYRPMVQDLFNMRLNRVKIPVKGKEGISQQQEYEIDFDDDFWTKNAAAPFQDVTQNVPKALDDLTKKLNTFNKKAGMNVSDAELLSGNVTKDDEVKNNEKMSLNKEMMEEVFKLAEARKRVDMHTNIAYAILHEVNRRKIDEFVAIEESLIKNKQLEKPVLLSLLKPEDTEKGTLNDKIRLLLICYLHYLQKLQQGNVQSSEITKQELEQFETALQRERERTEIVSKMVGDDPTEDLENGKKTLPELAFLRSLNLQNSQFGSSSVSRSGSSSTLAPSSHKDFSARTGSFANLALNFGETLLGNIAAGLQNYGSDKSFQLPLTRVVDAIVNYRPHKLLDSEQFVIIDPKMPPNSSQIRVLTNNAIDGGGKHSSLINANGDSHNTFNDVIVFVVGGGNYMEYQNLSEFFSQQANRGIDEYSGGRQHHFTYGCTDVVTGEQFLEQLKLLGEKTTTTRKK